MENGVSSAHSYSRIEMAAHEVRPALSREIQMCEVRELVAKCALQAVCPDCQRRGPAEGSRREVKSVDGPLELFEA